jgi:hypothetical protein
MPDWISNSADIIGIISAILAAIFSIKTNVELKHEKLRLNGKIQVQLKQGDNIYNLPTIIQRAELSRAEVLGRLGMIPMKAGSKQPRFSIDAVSSTLFVQEIDKIKNGTGDATLIILCTQNEFKQFEL